MQNENLELMRKLMCEMSKIPLHIRNTIEKLVLDMPDEWFNPVESKANNILHLRGDTHGLDRIEISNTLDRFVVKVYHETNQNVGMGLEKRHQYDASILRLTAMLAIYSALSESY